MPSRSVATLPEFTLGNAGIHITLKPTESPEQMDPSVRQFARPADSTESLPLTPNVGFRVFTLNTSEDEETSDSGEIGSDMPTPMASPAIPTPRARATTLNVIVSSEGMNPPELLSPANDVTKLSREDKPKQPPPPRKRSDSVTTYNGGGAESIFRLLPRETRPALRRMLFVEPTGRCTLTDLLKGKGKASGLLCGCRTVGGVTPGGHCLDHDFDPEDEDDGDEWLRDIPTCSTPGARPHVHIKVVVEENHSKRRFFLVIISTRYISFPSIHPLTIPEPSIYYDLCL